VLLICASKKNSYKKSIYQDKLRDSAGKVNNYLGVGDDVNATAI